MSTHAYVGKENKNGTISAIYVHSDGYPSYIVPLLLGHYNDQQKVEELIALGDLSELKEKLYPDPSQPHGFDFEKRQPGVTVAYTRDRGEDWTHNKPKFFANRDDFLGEEIGNGFFEMDYYYLWSAPQGWLIHKGKRQFFPCDARQALRLV